MQMWGQWGSVGTVQGIHPGHLEWWSKSVGESTATKTGTRLRWTCMQHHPKERQLCFTCLRALTIVIRTIRWKACEGKLRS